MYRCNALHSKRKMGLCTKHKVVQNLCNVCIGGVYGKIIVLIYSCAENNNLLKQAPQGGTYFCSSSGIVFENRKTVQRSSIIRLSSTWVGVCGVYIFYKKLIIYGYDQNTVLYIKGPYIKDVRPKSGFSDPPPPCVQVKQYNFLTNNNSILGRAIRRANTLILLWETWMANAFWVLSIW